MDRGQNSRNRLQINSPQGLIETTRVAEVQPCHGVVNPTSLFHHLQWGSRCFLHLTPMGFRHKNSRAASPKIHQRLVYGPSTLGKMYGLTHRVVSSQFQSTFSGNDQLIEGRQHSCTSRSICLLALTKTSDHISLENVKSTPGFIHEG